MLPAGQKRCQQGGFWCNILVYFWCILVHCWSFWRILGAFWCIADRFGVFFGAFWCQVGYISKDRYGGSGSGLPVITYTSVWCILPPPPGRLSRPIPQGDAPSMFEVLAQCNNPYVLYPGRARGPKLIPPADTPGRFRRMGRSCTVVQSNNLYGRTPPPRP